MNRIGTSGWLYNGWIGNFYPEGIKTNSLFDYYASRFDTVELNTTFYHLPKISTVRSWAEKAPPGFAFAVKASRYISHAKKFLDPEEPLKKFFGIVENLGEKLGPALFQTPPGFKINLERLRNLLEILPRERRCAFEFRDKSWLKEETCALLRKFNVALCFYDFKGFRSPLLATADFAYLRLHGPTKRAYAGSYSEKELSFFADFIKKQNEEGRDAYAYFDNDADGFAPHNALRLKQMLQD